MVLNLFQEAVERRGLTSCVRGNMGVKNGDVTYYTLSHPAQGPARHSHITGRSVHNLHIERPWRDVYQSVLSVSFEIFLSPEEERTICSVCTLCTKPLINQMLSTFTSSWLNQKVRTGGNRTPMQLFIMGMQ